MFSPTWRTKTFTEASETTQLTNISTETPILVEIVPTVPVVPVDPYPKNTPSDILSREYLILDTTLSAGTTTTLSPYHQLIQIPTIASYLSRFLLFRSHIKVRVQFLTSPMQFGTVMVSQMPEILETDSTWAQVWQQSQSDCVCLDITGQENHEVVLPYFRRKLYHELSVEDEPDWVMRFHPFNIGRISSTAPSTVRMHVFASFQNPEAAMYTVPAAEGVFQSHPNIFARMRQWATIGKDFGSVLAAGAAVAKGTEKIKDAVLGDNTATDSRGLFSNSEPVVGPDSTHTSAARLELLGDLTTPAISGVAPTMILLGDGGATSIEMLPADRNDLDMPSIMRRLTYVSTHVFSAIEDTVTLGGSDPFEDSNTYASYFSRMFKYYRGGVRYTLVFNTATLVRARFKIVLFPSGVVVSPSIGDFPSWIVDISGGTHVVDVDLPYFNVNPWQFVGDVPAFFPTVTIQPLAQIPQPFDVATTVAMHVFASHPDMKFAGLESFVPEELSGQFQSFVSTTSDFGYQRAPTNLIQVISRYSSRTGDPSNLYPFPIKITALNKHELDNYDYVAALYKYYTGSCKLKVLFSTAPANGLLQMEIANSKNAADGVDFKTANSAVITHQSVWPSIDAVFPYLNSYPYDSHYDPNGAYPLKYSNEATVSRFLIAPTSDFRLLYLLPVPNIDFGDAMVRPARLATFPVKPVLEKQEKPIKVPSPEEDAIIDLSEGVFQSLSPIARLVGKKVIYGTIAGTVGTTAYNSGVVDAETAYYTGTYFLRLDCAVHRTSGSEEASWRAEIRPTITNTTAFSPTTLASSSTAVVACGGRWIDPNNNGRYVSVSSCSASPSNLNVSSNLVVGFAWTSTANSSAFTLEYTLTIYPWSGSTFLMSPQVTSDTVGYIQSNIIGSVTLPISSATTLSTSVVNVPDVNVVNTPSVSVPGGVAITGPDPLPVVVDSSEPIAAQIQGMENPEFPVWINSYH